MKLIDFMVNIKDDTEIVSIGARSGFFFIGNNIEFVRIIREISEEYNTDFTEREVKNYYRKESGELAVIIEGSESGKYWERKEWLNNYGEYVKELH